MYDVVDDRKLHQIVDELGKYMVVVAAIQKIKWLGRLSTRSVFSFLLIFFTLKTHSFKCFLRFQSFLLYLEIIFQHGLF